MKINIHAGDREIIRMTTGLLRLAMNELKGINDGHFKSQISACIDEIKNVKSKLHDINHAAISFELPPGSETPQ